MNSVRTEDGSTVHEVQDVRVDTLAGRAWVAGVRVRLSPKEFKLLAALISRSGRVVSRQELMAEVWRQPGRAASRTLDVHLGLLRRKLGDDPRHPHLISTVRGLGLRFETEPRANSRRPPATTTYGER